MSDIIDRLHVGAGTATELEGRLCPNCVQGQEEPRPAETYCDLCGEPSCRQCLEEYPNPFDRHRPHQMCFRCRDLLSAMEINTKIAGVVKIHEEELRQAMRRDGDTYDAAFARLQTHVIGFLNAVAIARIA